MLENLFKKIQDSIYSPPFYKQIKQKNLNSSLGYFLTLASFLVILQSIILIKPLLFDLPGEVRSFSAKAADNFPGDLSVKIENGKAYPSVKEPYIIPFSTIAPELKPTSNFLVIDTKTPYSPEKFQEYNTLLWLTKDTLFSQSTNNTKDIRAYKLENIGNFTFDKGFVKYLENRFMPWIKFIGPVVFAASVIGLYIVIAFRLVYWLIFALILMLLSKLFKWNFDYKQSYKIGLYAMTLGLIIESIIFLSATFTNFHGFPFMFTLITFGVIFLNFRNYKYVQ